MILLQIENIVTIESIPFLVLYSFVQIIEIVRVEGATWEKVHVALTNQLSDDKLSFHGTRWCCDRAGLTNKALKLTDLYFLSLISKPQIVCTVIVLSPKDSNLMLGLALLSN